VHIWLIFCHAREYIFDVTDWRLGGVLYVDYKFTDDKLWNKFRKSHPYSHLNHSWNSQVSRDTSSYCLSNPSPLGQVPRTISQNPVLKIQKLCLTDLPTELLDKVFQHTRWDKASILSSTCQQLRHIARRLIFAVSGPRLYGLRESPIVNNL
jgi:hypothetical protein